MTAACNRVLDRVDYWTSGCWVFLGARSAEGYGVISVGNRYRLTHRVVYESAKGAIPEGLEIDHLCRNRACVRPIHLEAVTHAENINRGEAPGSVTKRAQVCRRGHPYPGNRQRNRHCLICERARG